MPISHESPFFKYKPSHNLRFKKRSIGLKLYHLKQILLINHHGAPYVFHNSMAGCHNQQCRFLFQSAFEMPRHVKTKVCRPQQKLSHNRPLSCPKLRHTRESAHARTFSRDTLSKIKVYKKNSLVVFKWDNKF